MPLGREWVEGEREREGEDLRNGRYDSDAYGSMEKRERGRERDERARERKSNENPNSLR